MRPNAFRIEFVLDAFKSFYSLTNCLRRLRREKKPGNAIDNCFSRGALSKSQDRSAAGLGLERDDPKILLRREYEASCFLPGHDDVIGLGAMRGLLESIFGPLGVQPFASQISCLRTNRRFCEFPLQSL